MKFVVLDLETFYTDERPPFGRQNADGKFPRYTLDDLTTEEYIRHPWFQAHGAAVRWAPDQPARWYDEAQLRLELAKQDWSDVFLICHHFAFDGLILSHHYNIHPKMRGCTLSMARLLLGNHLSVSLDSVRRHFGMASKSTPYHLFRGKRWGELDQYARIKLAEGCVDEVESIWHIFCKFISGDY